MNVWQEPFVPLRLPKLFNLRCDPFETADHEGMDYERWRVEHLFVMVPAQQYVGKFLGTFKEYPPSQKPGASASMEHWRRSRGARRVEADSCFPPRQKPSSFSVDEVMASMTREHGG